MARQLNLDRDKIEHCYNLASQIIGNASKYIDRHSSPSVERATLMLLGVTGEYRGASLASLMVEKLTKDQLRLGVANWWGKALFHFQEEPAQLAEKLARGKIKWSDLPEAPPAEIRNRTTKLAEEGFQRLGAFRKRPDLLLRFDTTHPTLAVQLQESKPKRIPSSANEWREKGVTLATARLQSKDFFKEQFPLESCNIAWKPLKGTKTVVVTEGLSISEQVLLGMELELPAMVLDGWAPILKGELDAKRSLTDQSFALSLCGAFPMQILNLPVDLKSPQLLSHLLLYEQLARRQGVPYDKVMLGFAPLQEKGIIGSLAFAQVLREMFSKSPLWYSLPNKIDPFAFVTANVADLNVVWLSASQEMHQQALLWSKEADGLSDALQVNTHGRIGREAHLILDNTWKELRRLHQLTLWKALDENEVKSNVGGEGVFQKSFHYWNPVANLLTKAKEEEF